MEKLIRASRNYTIFGLAAGIYCRELCRYFEFGQPSYTQLRVLHTHCFSLGTLFFLIVLMLEKNFGLTKQKNYKKFYMLYSMGLGITLMMLTVEGTLSVMNKEVKSRWLTWTSGAGHILMTIGFGYFFDVLTKAVKATASESKTDEEKRGS